MATVVEMLELSGVPALCAARAAPHESGMKIGAILADALQVSHQHAQPHLIHGCMPQLSTT